MNITEARTALTAAMPANGGANYELALAVSKKGATPEQVEQAMLFAGLTVNGATRKKGAVKAAPALLTGLILGKHINGNLASAVRTMNNARAAVAAGAESHRTFIQAKVLEREAATHITDETEAAKTKALATLTEQFFAEKARIEAL